MRKNDFLIVSPPQASLGRPIYKTLKQLNFKVEIFDDELNFINNKLGLKFPNYRERLIDRINKKLLKAVHNVSPRFVLVMKGKNIRLDTLKKIKNKGIKTINFFPEYISHWRSMSYLAPAYDYFLVPCHYVLNQARKQGFQNFHYLTFAAELSKDAEFPQIKNYLYDVTFIGSVNNDYYPERVEFLSSLTDFDLHIWGNKDWKKTILKSFYHNRPSDKKMFEIYRQSKIVVNIDYHQAPIDGVNIRPFEATACGSLLINDAISPDIFRLFKEGEEFVPFKEGTDLKEKVNYYLSHENERIRIARAGFERTKREHTYFDRMQELIKIIGL